MTKKMVDTELASVKYGIAGCTLEEVLHKVKQWIHAYGGNTKFDIGEVCESYDYSNTQYAYVRLVGQREESDEAYTKRMAEEKDRKDRQEARDKVEFERLQKKFSGDPK